MMKKVKSNVYVLQGCFRRVLPVMDFYHDNQSVTYLANEHKTDFYKGYEEKIVEHTYPITPEFVTSFADSVDYKKDPEGTILAPRQNLGDVSGIQDVLKKDTPEVRSFLADLKSALKSVSDNKQFEAKVEDKKESE